MSISRHSRLYMAFLLCATLAVGAGCRVATAPTNSEPEATLSPAPAAPADATPAPADPPAPAKTPDATPVTAAAVSPAGPPPVDGDWLVLRLKSEPSTLNILLDTADAYANQMTGDLFETMLDRDKDTLEIVPKIAESYEIADDHLTYTFHLRKNVYFSDGVPLTANDVKFTLDLIKDPKNETADIRNYYQDVASYEVLDDYTIRFVCSKPYFKHLDMLGGIPIYPRHIYGQGDLASSEYNRKPVGSGPYVFESWDTNQQITFARDENYWDKTKTPHILKRVYKIILDDNAAFQVLQRNEIDTMGLRPEQWVGPAKEQAFEAKFTKLTYWATTGYVGSYSYIAWNMRRPMFQDKMVRRALTMLLDRQTVLEQVYYGLGKVISGGAASQSAEYDQTIAPWPYDPEQAMRLLDQSGWVDTDGDGVRDKDGAPFRFEFMYPSGSAEVEIMANDYKQELQRAGIDMTIRPLEWATMLDFLTKRNFDATTLSWAIPVDQDPYQVWHSSQTEKGSNYPGFQNAELDAILDQARLEFDRVKRNELYKNWHAILHEEQPYTFLFNHQALVAVDKRFQDVKLYTQGLRYIEWWTPAEARRYW